MIDDELRSLERAARERPSDSAAGWALITALRRAEDWAGALGEVSRLARSGDEEARAQVLGARKPLRRDPTETVRRMVDSGYVVSHPVATRNRLFVSHHGRELVALDAETLQASWDVEASRSHRCHLWSLGEHVVVGIAGEKATLSVRDAARGRIEVEANLPPVTSLMGDGDRVVGTDREGRLLGLSAGTGFGNQLWRRDGEREWLQDVVGGRMLIHPEHDDLLVHDTSTGECVWTLRESLGEGEGAERVKDYHCTGGDFDSLLLVAQSPLTRTRRVVVVDAKEGCLRASHSWETDAEALTIARLGRDAFVFSQPDGETETLIGANRTNGKALWSAPLAANDFLELAIADDVLYVATSTEQAEPALTVRARRLQDGTPLFSTDLLLDPAHWRFRPFAIRLVPLDRCLIVIVGDHHRSVLIRLEEGCSTS